MSKLSYREIIEANIRQARAKSTRQDGEYWKWVVSELVSDLDNYEGRSSWANSLAINYQHRIRLMSLDEFLRRFFGEGWF